MSAIQKAACASRLTVFLITSTIVSCLAPAETPVLEVGDAKSLLIAVTKAASHEVVAVHAYSLPLQEGISWAHDEDNLELFAMTFPCSLPKLGITEPELVLSDDGAKLPKPGATFTYAVSDQRWISTDLPDSLSTLRFAASSEGRCHGLTQTRLIKTADTGGSSALSIDSRGDVWFKTLEQDGPILHHVIRNGDAVRIEDSASARQSLHVDDRETIWMYGPRGQLASRERGSDVTTTLAQSGFDPSELRSRVIGVPGTAPLRLVTLGAAGQLSRWDSVDGFTKVMPEVLLPSRMLIVPGELIPIGRDQVLAASVHASLIVGTTQNQVTPVLGQNCLITTGALDAKNGRVIIASSCGEIFQSELELIKKDSWTAISHEGVGRSIRSIATIGNSLLVNFSDLGSGGMIQEIDEDNRFCEPTPVALSGLEQLAIRSTDDGEVIAALAIGAREIAVYILEVTERPRTCE